MARGRCARAGGRGSCRVCLNAWLGVDGAHLRPRLHWRQDPSIGYEGLLYVSVWDWQMAPWLAGPGGVGSRRTRAEDRSEKSENCVLCRDTKAALRLAIGASARCEEDSMSDQEFASVERKVIDVVVVRSDGTYEDGPALGPVEVEEWIDAQDPPVGVLAIAQLPNQTMVWFLGDERAEISADTGGGTLNVRSGGNLIRAFSPSGWLQFSPQSRQVIEED